MNCHVCGATLEEIDRWDGEREFTLYQCQGCGRTGGKASGDGLPDATWGACGRKIVADGGRIEGEEVCDKTAGGSRR